MYLSPLGWLHFSVMAREEIVYSFLRCLALCFWFFYIMLVHRSYSAAAQGMQLLSMERDLFQEIAVEGEGESALL